MEALSCEKNLLSSIHLPKAPKIIMKETIIIHDEQKEKQIAGRLGNSDLQVFLGIREKNP